MAQLLLLSVIVIEKWKKTCISGQLVWNYIPLKVIYYIS